MRGASDNETGALILTMDKADLASLVGFLREGAVADVPLSPTMPGDVTRPVARLSLRPIEAAPLLVTVRPEEATISGSPENFSCWADELSEFERENDLDEPGIHAHFDPAEPRLRGLEISAESAEVIVTGPFSDD